MVPRAQELLGGGFPIPMTYYKNWQTQNASLSKLLRYHDSQCGSWAQFFMRSVNTAGYDLINEHAAISDNRPPIPDGGDRPFFVNNWTFASSTNPDEYWNKEYPYINIPTGAPETTFMDGNYYHWLFEDVVDTTGISGQGPTSDPASIFHQHFVIKVNGKYYDPSYGVTYTSLANMDDTAIAGYSVSFGFYDPGPGRWINELELMTDLNGDGNIDNTWVEVPVFYIQQNPAGSNELKEELSNPPR